MNEEELMPESSRSLESLRIVRLNALLRDMLRDEGVVKTARLLGVTYRNPAQSGRVGQPVRTYEPCPGAASAFGGRLGCGPAAGAG